MYNYYLSRSRNTPSSSKIMWETITLTSKFLASTEAVFSNISAHGFFIIENSNARMFWAEFQPSRSNIWKPSMLFDLFSNTSVFSKKASFTVWEIQVDGFMALVIKISGGYKNETVRNLWCKHNSMILSGSMFVLLNFSSLSFSISLFTPSCKSPRKQMLSEWPPHH